MQYQVVDIWTCTERETEDRERRRRTRGTLIKMIMLIVKITMQQGLKSVFHSGTDGDRKSKLSKVKSHTETAGGGENVSWLPLWKEINTGENGTKSYKHCYWQE